jgi:hypothetical protein
MDVAMFQPSELAYIDTLLMGNANRGIAFLIRPLLFFYAFFGLKLKSLRTCAPTQH